MPGIDRERWRTLSEHLDHALELPERERQQWLAVLAEHDPDTAGQLTRLLAVREQRGFPDFLGGAGTMVADALAGSTLLGRQVGSYVIEAEIGVGGMGSVWRARRADGRFEGAVAVKFVHPSLLGRDGERRFQLEGSLLARLDHPNIARLIDAGVLDTAHPYLVLEYVEGEPIDAHCERAALGIETRVRMFLDVLAAVAHAHSHLIVHRDIKPSNVFVTRGGTVKLLDFGIAKLLDRNGGASDLTLSSARALTPLYAAPEQLLGQAVTTATDVYSLGLVLYVLLAGSHPLATDTRSGPQLVEAILTEDPAPASTMAGDAGGRRRALEGDLDNILGKALKKDPVERYASVGAFAEDLRRYLDHEPVQARPDTVTYRVAKFVRRHRGSVLSGMLLATTLVATSVFALLQMSDAQRQRDVSRTELRRAEAANDFSSLMLEELGEGGGLMSREQLLARGLELLDARYGGDRDFVADMLTQLAARYRDADRIDIAIDLTKRSIDLARQTGDPTLLAITLCESAHMEVVGQAAPHVDAYLDEAQGLIASLRDVPDRLAVICLRARAERASAAGKWNEGIALLEEAHAIHVAGGVQTGLGYTAVLNDLGVIYFSQGRFPDAYRMTSEVGAAFDRGGRGATVGRRTIHENAAASLMAMGEPRAALAELEAAHLLGSEHATDIEVPQGSRPLLALTLRRLGRLQEAQSLIAGTAERMLAANNPRIASSALVQEGAVAAELSATEPARRLLERAIALMLQHPSGRAGALAQAHGLLADLDTRTGRPDAARRRLEEFLGSAGYRQEPTKAVLRPALASAARALLALGDLPGAERYAGDALAIAEKAARGPDSSADVGELLIVLARLKTASHRPAEAIPLLERAIRCLTNALGTDARPTNDARDLLRAMTVG